MKILIVEDDEKLAHMLKIAFKINNFQAVYFTDGLLANQEIQTRHEEYALIILDLMLPSVSGLEIAEKAKKNRIPVPIFILSARNNREDITRAARLGVKSYFVKPFSFSDLLEKVKETLQ